MCEWRLADSEQLPTNKYDATGMQTGAVGFLKSTRRRRRVGHLWKVADAILWHRINPLKRAQMLLCVPHASLFGALQQPPSYSRKDLLRNVAAASSTLILPNAANAAVGEISPLDASVRVPQSHRHLLSLARVPYSFIHVHHRSLSLARSAGSSTSRNSAPTRTTARCSSTRVPSPSFRPTRASISRPLCAARRSPPARPSRASSLRARSTPTRCTTRCSTSSLRPSRSSTTRR